MRRFSGLKNWWHTKSFAGKFFNICFYSTMVPFTTVFTGNMCSSVFISYKKSGGHINNDFYDHISFLSRVSFFKAICYIALGPFIVPLIPLDISIWLLSKPVYIKNNYHSLEINGHSIWRHFIPGSHDNIIPIPIGNNK